MQDNQNQALSTDSSRPTTDQALRMITDLWGAMIALFGVRWSSQFGETPDASGQWRQTLLGISRQQVADALSEIRNCGRAWPPTAPEFRAMCLNSGKDKPMPMEAAYAEMCRYVRGGLKEYSHLSPILYHTIARNLDLYNYRQTEEWKALKMFEIAYKATLFQIECGEELLTPPPPETLLPRPDKKTFNPSPDELKKGTEAIASILANWDKPEDKQLTKDEINDLQRLERVKNGGKFNKAGD